MKYLFTAFLLIVLSLTVQAQNIYEYVWSMNQMPFQQAQKSSEMAMVKAGFDTDNDGKGEFICAYTDLDSNYIMMYEANGNDTYDLVWYWLYPVPANSFAGITVGDMDDDGVPEIITTMPSTTVNEPNPPRLWIFEWNGVQGENKYGVYGAGDMAEPTISWNFNVDDNTDFRPYSLIVEDIDNDGTSELIVGSRQGTRGREVLIASLVGEFGGFASFDIEYNLQGLSGGSLYSVTTGDLDNDGNREVHALIWNYLTFHVIECTGPDTYELKNSLETIMQSTSVDYGAVDGVVCTDIDGNGKNELFIAGTEVTNTVFVVSDVDDVSTLTADDFKVLMEVPVNALGKLRSMQVFDFDNDGNMSLAVAGETNGQLYDIEYDGDGDPALAENWVVNVAFDIFQYSGFDPAANPTISPRLFYASPAADMDGDGENEFVTVNYRSTFDVWPGDGYIFMVEHRTPNSVADDNKLNPDEFGLSQNYPNPFNPTTNISYNIPEAGFVTLRVYDVLGNLVSEVIDGYKEAGIHRAEFNASNLSSGAYFYRIEYNGQSLTKKLLLMK